MRYFSNIFEKLNILDKQRQRTNKTLVESKAKIFGFATLIEFFYKHFQQEISPVSTVKIFEVTDTAAHVIVNHRKTLPSDLNDRLTDSYSMLLDGLACGETGTKYKNSTSFAGKLLLPFLSPYLAECGISVENDLLLMIRNAQDITKRGDVILKLTKLVPNIKSLPLA